jgi:sugar phosphate isomerase/epimerase
VAVASWPFRAYIDSPMNDERDLKRQGMDLQDFAAHVRDKFNISNIEPYNHHFKSLDPAYLAKLREKLEKGGSRAVNIAADFDSSYYDAEAGTRGKAVAEARKWIDAAVAIGCPSVRTSMPQAKNSAPNIEHAAESLRKVADYGASRNVVVHLENDNLTSEDAFFLEKLIKRVNHPYLHALPDFGNSLGSGDPDFAARAMKALFPLAYGISHVKPISTTRDGKTLEVDMAGTFATAKASGYRGYFSMEYEGPGDLYAETAHLIQRTAELV